MDVFTAKPCGMTTLAVGSPAKLLLRQELRAALPCRRGEGVGNGTRHALPRGRASEWLSDEAATWPGAERNSATDLPAILVAARLPAVLAVMDAAVAVAQCAAAPFGKPSLHFAQDGERDLFRRLGANVQSRRRTQTRRHGIAPQPRQQVQCPPPRTQDAQVAQR